MPNLLFTPFQLIQQTYFILSVLLYVYTYSGVLNPWTFSTKSIQHFTHSWVNEMKTVPTPFFTLFIQNLLSFCTLWGMKKLLHLTLKFSNIFHPLGYPKCQILFITFFSFNLQKTILSLSYGTFHVLVISGLLSLQKSLLHELLILKCFHYLWV